MDHRNDCIITIFTMISILLSRYGIHFIDGITGMGISIWILISGAKIFRESYNVLMDISLDEDTRQQILDITEEYNEIANISEIITNRL